MSHTPGPWTITLLNTPHWWSVGGAYLIKAGERFVARLTDEEGDREANARLIAEAPAMCELLTDVGRWFEAALTRGQINGGTANRDGDLVSQIRALLARIDGGEQP